MACWKWIFSASIIGIVFTQLVSQVNCIHKVHLLLIFSNKEMH